jgi:hypothetical protein
MIEHSGQLHSRPLLLALQVLLLLLTLLLQLGPLQHS